YLATCRRLVAVGDYDVELPLECAQHAGVAQSALRVLEVGLEQEGNVAAALVAVDGRFVEQTQPAARLLGQRLRQPGPELVDEAAVARDEPGGQHGGTGANVVVRDGHGLP